MSIIIQIILEVVFAFVTLFAASSFWQLIKRRAFLSYVIRDESFLIGYISSIDLASPPPSISFYADRTELGYFLNIQSAIQADSTIQRTHKIFFFILLLFVLIASYYFLGAVYLVVNLAIFLVLSFFPLPESAKFNALRHVWTLGLILYKWHKENPQECAQWIERASSLRHLYNAVIKKPVDEIEIPIIIQVELTDGWAGERWDVKDVIDERDGSSLGDIGVYDFDAYSDFPEILKDAVLDVLREYEAFDPSRFYSLKVSVKDGGTEIGEATSYFWGRNIRSES